MEEGGGAHSRQAKGLWHNGVLGVGGTGGQPSDSNVMSEGRSLEVLAGASPGTTH